MKNFKFYTFLLIVLFCDGMYGFAQSEAINWYFGNKAGIRFNKNGEFDKALTDGALNTGEGCAVLSTNEGKLIFYTDGRYVYNSQHKLMDNGSNLLGGSSSAQSSIIVPKPGSNKIYYIITTSELDKLKQLHYSVVDISLNDGLGKIIEKNISISEKIVSEKIAAIKHQNGNDFWLVSHVSNSSAILVYKITKDGIALDNTSNLGAITSYQDNRGYFRFSKENKEGVAKLAMTNFGRNVFLYDFNINTGKISNKQQISTRRAYGAEFSPNSKYLYYTEKHTYMLFRYDIKNKTTKSIETTCTGVKAIQIGPDNRLYIAREGESFLDVIETPNAQIINDVNYKSKEISLQGKKCNMGLPQFVQNYLFSPLFKVENSCIEEGATFEILNSSGINSVLWNFGDNGATSTEFKPTHIFSAPGTYTVTVTMTNNDSETTTESTEVVILPSPAVDLGNDVSFCKDGSTTLNATTTNAVSYLWNNGATNPSITVNEAGTYSVMVTDANGCVGSDEIVVSETELPQVSIKDMPQICNTDDPIDLTQFGEPQGGTFSGNGIVDNILTPEISMAGELTITYQYSDDNSCASSTERVITIEDCRCPYEFGTIEAQCGDLCDCVDEQVFCLPLKTKHPINDGIIGLDFCVEYDDKHLVPTGKVTIGEVVTNNGLYPQGEQSDYYINHTLTKGKVHVSLYYHSPAPSTAAFEYIKDGVVACVEFKLKSSYETGTKLVFTACELRESYQLHVEDKCVDPGSFVLNDQTILEANIIYWNDETRSLRYDSSNPEHYRITNITNCEKSNTPTQPDIDGRFEYDITNGISIRINRDIPGSFHSPCEDHDGNGDCDISDKVNGFDCYRTSLVTTMNYTFFPSIYEILAMDVNQSGSVEAGDITQIQNRFLKETQEFPQVWNYKQDPNNPTEPSRDWVFVSDNLVNTPEYQVSKQYPYRGEDDDSGFSKYKLPVTPFCLDIETEETAFCVKIPSTTYHAILLGDVNGDWKSDYKDDSPVYLKSGKNDEEAIVFDLSNAKIENENEVLIPITFKSDENCMSLDFIMEDFDNSTLDFMKMEYGDVNKNEFEIAYNNRVRAITFAKVFGGVSNSKPIFYLRFKANSKYVDSNTLGDVTGYLNGKKTKAKVIGQVNFKAGQTTSIDTNNEAENVSIYPNPVRDRLFVTTPNEKLIKSIKVVNMLGMTTKEYKDVNTSNFDIEMGTLQSGLYIIEVTVDNQQIRKEILVY